MVSILGLPDGLIIAPTVKAATNAFTLGTWRWGAQIPPHKPLSSAHLALLHAEVPPRVSRFHDRGKYSVSLG
jgi:hypothetical protein